MLALVAVGALAAVLLLAGSPGTAAAAPDPPATSDPAKAAAGYLARSLVDGTHYVSSGFVQYGPTADAIFSMAAAKAAGTAMAAATGYLATHAQAYVDPPGVDPPSDAGPYPGAEAKLALVAEVTGGDPHAFGGIDLLGTLRMLECPATGRPVCAGTPGLFRNDLASGGFPSVLNQSLAILALARSTVPADHPSAAAVDFLVGQQCSNGGLPFSIAAAGQACAPDVDTTGIAAQALVLAGRTDAARRALDWLTSVRQPNGAFRNSAGTVSANSTAYAVLGLIAGGRSAASSIAWLRSQQQGCAAPAGQRGGVAAFGTFAKDTALLATVQAGQALAGTPFTTLTATGVAPAAPVLECVAAPGPTPTSTAPAASLTPTPTPTPAAEPGLANTNAVDGRVVTRLTVIGAALVAAGLVTLLAVRRRT